MKIKVDVKGAKELKELFKRFGDEGEQEIRIVTESAAEEIAGDARKLAPVDRGDLQQSMKWAKVENKNDLLLYKVYSDEPYAGYVEFGTGSRVSVPSEMSDVAGEFKSGTGS